jgi:hypothetical protein
MNRSRRPLAALALTASVALISACGSSAPAGTGSSGGISTATKLENAVKFAECMRNNGVSGFPDPAASGALTIDGVINGSSLDPNSTAWKTAIGACKDLEPSGFTGHPRSAREQKGAFKFAQCIRENGVSDFPDPVNGQPLVDTNRIPSAATSNGMSILNAAMHKCRSVSPVAAGGQ